MSTAKNNIFQFKQFAVDQSDCAMKINTDGSLLGALSDAIAVEKILDIGAGTGVVALMLAQRFENAEVDAVEIEEMAAIAAEKNFINSPFSDRLSLYANSFQEFHIARPDKVYDLIVSNPPFFLDSLKNPDKNKQIARHADNNFFGDLIGFCASHLNFSGTLTLILPPETSDLCIKIAERHQLFLQERWNIKSFPESPVHRNMISFGFQKTLLNENVFVIYSSPKQYSSQFVEALKDFFIIF